jgi:hypothetical protein
MGIDGNETAKGFLKRTSVKTAEDLLKFSRNCLRIMTGLLTGHCHFKGTLWLLDCPKCDRCKQASETASHVLCDCDALAVLRLMQLGHCFLKPDDFADMSSSKVLLCIQSAGLLND